MRACHFYKYLPDYYDQNGRAADILTAQEEEFLKTEARYRRVRDDTNPATAEDIGYWENEFGVIPDADATLAERQAYIIMLMRGHETFTKAYVKRMCEGITSAEFDVDELPDDFLVQIFGHGTERTIPYVDVLIKFFKKNMPAHADIEAGYKWATWAKFKPSLGGALYTWREIKEIYEVNWDEIRWEFWQEEED